jgi:hypothetical protein
LSQRKARCCCCCCVITAPPIRRRQVGRPYLFCFSTAPLTSLTQANSEFLSESTKRSFRISIAGLGGWGCLQPFDTNVWAGPPFPPIPADANTFGLPLGTIVWVFGVVWAELYWANYITWQVPKRRADIQFFHNNA